jgi:hypothetical protein
MIRLLVQSQTNKQGGYTYLDVIVALGILKDFAQTLDLFLFRLLLHLSISTESSRKTRGSGSVNQLASFFSGFAAESRCFLIGF